MLLQEFKIRSLIDTHVLQQVQESFAQKHQVALVILDGDGNRLTKPTLAIPQASGTSVNVGQLLNNILEAKIDKYSLEDGQAIFASFFNRSIVRCVAPVIFFNEMVAIISFVALQKEFDAYTINHLRDIISGVPDRENVHIALLDKEPYFPSQHILNIQNKFNETLLMLLDAGFQRLKYSLAHQNPETGTDENILLQELTYGIILTSRAGDIIESNKIAASSLAYDSADEMLGLNVIQHLVLEDKDRNLIKDELSRSEKMDWFPLILERKDGTILKTQMSIHAYRNENDRLVGYKYIFEPALKEAGGEENDRNNVNPLLSDAGDANRADRPDDETWDLSFPGLDSLVIPEARDPYPMRPSRPDSSKKAEPIKLETPDKSEEQKSLHDLNNLSNSDVPTIVLDSNDKIFLWNKRVEQIFGFPSLSVVNTEFSSYLAGNQRQQWEKILSDFIQNTAVDQLKIQETIFFLDRFGDIVRTRVLLNKDSILGNTFVRVTILEWDKEVDPLTEVIKAMESEENYTEESEIDLDKEEPSTTFEQEIVATAFDCHWVIPIEDEQAFKKGIMTRPDHFIAKNSMHRNRLIERLLYDPESFTDESWQTFIERCLYVFKSGSTVKEVITSHHDKEELEFYHLRHTIYPLRINGKIAGVQGLCLNLSHYIQDRFELESMAGRFKRVLEISGLGYFRYSPIEKKVLEINVRGLAILGFSNIEELNRSNLFTRLIERVQFETTELTISDNRISSTITNFAVNDNAPFSLYIAYEILTDYSDKVIYEGILKVGEKASESLSNHYNTLQKSKAALSSSSGSRHGKKTILLVEDEPDIVEVIDLTLSQEGFTVISTDRGNEALKIAREQGQAIDLIIIDLTLPDMSGIECAKEIEKLLGDKPIIMSSGYNRNQAASEIINRTNGAWLQKPFNSSTLISLIEQTLHI